MLILSFEEFNKKFVIDNESMSNIRIKDIRKDKSLTPIEVISEKVYYFDIFGVATPPLFLGEYVDLGSNERIQEYNESYWGAYMIYLIYRIFKIEGALVTLINQVKCPVGYKKCQCLGC